MKLIALTFIASLLPFFGFAAGDELQKEVSIPTYTVPVNIPQPVQSFLSFVLGQLTKPIAILVILGASIAITPMRIATVMIVLSIILTDPSLIKHIRRK